MRVLETAIKISLFSLCFTICGYQNIECVFGQQLPDLTTVDKSNPKPIPGNRVEIKSLLQDLKSRKPRLPVPTEEEMPPPSAGSAQAESLSKWGSVINGRSRRYYLPDTWFSGEVSSGPDSQNQLVDYRLKTMCFWIVSRGNNCHYCLGHQEHKLKMEGFSDDQLASLDCNWDMLPTSERKALSLAKKMTLQPYAIEDIDIEELRPEFDDAQIIELVFTIARFNATNRWTDSLGLPQDSIMRGTEVEFMTTSDAKWESSQSIVTVNTVGETPECLSYEDVEKALAIARSRTPRVQLASAEHAIEVFELDSNSEPSKLHRALAQMPSINKLYLKNMEAMVADQELSPELKAQLLFTTAHHNQAWYALSMAKNRLTDMGWSENDLRSLVTLNQKGVSSTDNPNGDQISIAFAKKLTVNPQLITDQDVEALKVKFSDRQVAHIIHVVAFGNALDRFTKTLGL